jgi:hypothetical protein
MLIPRFSIRWLLGLTTFSACISLVLSYAVRGQPWAIGVVAGLWVLVATFLFFAAAFLVAWFITGGQTNPALQTDLATTNEPGTAQPPSPPLHSSQAIDLPPPITG